MLWGETQAFYCAVCSTQKCSFWYAPSLLCKWFGKKSPTVICYDIGITAMLFSYAF